MELIDLFDRGVGLDPSAACLEMSDGSRALSYGQVYELTHRLASRLRRMGIDVGSRVGVISSNEPVAFVAVLAVLRLGATWIPLNARSSAVELGELLDLCSADLVLCHEDHSSTGEAVTSDVRRVVSIGDGSLSHPAWVGLLDSPDARIERSRPTNPVAVLAGTGGTTGTPKAVQLGHGQLYHQSLGFMAHLPEATPPTQIVAAPMTHTAGSISFPVLAAGGRSIIHHGVVAEELLRSIQTNRATRLFLPPTAIYSLLNSPALGTYDTSSLAHFLYLAAPMSETKLLDAIEAFGPVMCQTYGQTEAPTICTWFSREEHSEAAARPELRHRLTSCGRPSVVADVAVLGDDGSVLGPGEQGELAVRGPLVMDGYLNNPEATAAALRAGWLLTGDIARRDTDGFVYIVDRTKDLIISGGFNVFPGEVERVLLSHPQVKDAAVIGIPDDKWGEAVTAVIEVRDGDVADPEVIRAYCRERLGGIKAPKSILVSALPRSAVGKVLKRELRDTFWKGFDRNV
jgi:acyl-CoA synthetase (AMP-forming)/AMP-acid ligase II